MNEKSKKDQKNLEKIVKEIFSLGNKEKPKLECCLKLLEIFENCIDVNINFEVLMSAIDDFYSSPNILCKRVWMRIALFSIKFKNELRPKLFDKIMSVTFMLPKEDYVLKCKAIQTATNSCLDISAFSKEKIFDFLFFEVVLLHHYFREPIFVSILNLIQVNMVNKKNDDFYISKFLLELVTEAMLLIVINKLIQLKDLTAQYQSVIVSNNIVKENYFNTTQTMIGDDKSLDHIPSLSFTQSSVNSGSLLLKIDEEKHLIKTLITFFDFYLKEVVTPRSSLFKALILVYCSIVNIEREFSWKSLKNVFVLNPKKTFSELLDILNSSNLVLEFVAMDKYLFYDYVNEYKEHILLVNYINYIKKSQDDISVFLVKSRTKLTIGSIYFIGMAVWGYEKIDLIDIPYTIVLSHLLKLAKENNKAINKDIIFCLKRLIKKYGDSLLDEWSDIFEILKLVIMDMNQYMSKYQSKPNMSVKELSIDRRKMMPSSNHEDRAISAHVQVYYNFIEFTYKNVCEIIDTIKLMILLNKFPCCHQAFGNILDILKVPPKPDKAEKPVSFLIDKETNGKNSNAKTIHSYNVSKHLFRIVSCKNFLENLETLIIDYLLNDHSDRVRITLLEYIRLNYVQISLREGLKRNKSETIEGIIAKHLASILSCLKNGECMNYLVFCLKDILLETSDLLFFENVIKILIFQSHDYYSVTKPDRAFLIINTQIQILISLYFHLSKSFQTKKLEILNLKIIGITKSKQNLINYNLLLLGFLDNLIITECHKIFVKGVDIAYYNSVIKHGIWPVSLNCTQISTDIKNSSPNAVQIIGLIEKLQDLNKLSGLQNSSISSESISYVVGYAPFIVLRHEFLYDYLIDLLNQDATNLFLCEFILRILNKLIKTFAFYKNIKIEKLITSILSINDIKKYMTKPSLIDIILDTLLSLSSIFKATKEMKIYYIYDEQLLDKFFSNLLNCIKSLYTSIKNEGQFSENDQKSQSRSSSMKGLKKNGSVEIQAPLDLVPNTSADLRYFYISKLLNSLSIFITNTYASLLKPENDSQFKSMRKKILDCFNQVFDSLQEIRKIATNSIELSLGIINFITLCKDYIRRLQDETLTLKFIYLVMSIVWVKYESETYKLFSETFNLKLKKFSNDSGFTEVNPNIRLGNIKEFVQLKTYFLNQLGDSLLCFLCQYSNVNLYSLCMAIFNMSQGNFGISPTYYSHLKKTLSVRESIFLDLLKWIINFKNLNKSSVKVLNDPDQEPYYYRDNLPINLKQKLESYQTVYLCENTIITLYPTNEQKYDVVIRNAIANISFSMEFNLETNFTKQSSEDCLNFLKKEFETDFESAVVEQSEPKPEAQAGSKDLPGTAMINNIVFKQIMSILTEEDSLFSEIAYSKSIEENLFSLDCTSVYNNLNTSIIYLPNQNSITETELICYSGLVTSTYLKFLSKLGKLIDSSKLASVYQTYAAFTNTNTQYVRKLVQYQDFIYQHNFNINHLIKIKEDKYAQYGNNQDLLLFRKKTIGNNYLVIVFQQSNQTVFNPSIITSSVIMLYLIVKCLNGEHFVLKLVENPRAKFKILSKILKYFPAELVLNSDNICPYLQQLTILLNCLINYYLQKEELLYIKKESVGNVNVKYTNSEMYTGNLSNRYNEIEKICSKFKS